MIRVATNREPTDGEVVHVVAVRVWVRYGRSLVRSGL